MISAILEFQFYRNAFYVRVIVHVIKSGKRPKQMGRQF